MYEVCTAVVVKVNHYGSSNQQVEVDVTSLTTHTPYTYYSGQHPSVIKLEIM